MCFLIIKFIFLITLALIPIVIPCITFPARAIKSRLIKVKSASSLVAYTAGAYPGFRSIKRLGVFLLPPGWDASPS